MLQINISTQPIRLDYTINNAKLNLQSTPAKLQMETMAATLEIHQPRGETDDRFVPQSLLNRAKE